MFDLVGRDVSASRTFKNVGDSAERAGRQTSTFGTAVSGAMKLAGGALLGAGLIQGFRDLYQAAAESQKIGRLTAQVIKSTGGAAGLSAKQVSDLAAAISAKTGIDDEAIQSGQNLLLTFTNIKNAAGEGNDIFTQTTQIMTDMSVALGTDASGSAIQLGKALNDPIKGVAALTRVGVSFTQAQKDQIAALVETGDLMGAQKIILAELSREFGGAAEAAATPFDKLKVTLGNVAEELGGYLIPLVDRFATFMIEDAIPAIRDAAGWLGDHLGPAVSVVFGAFKDIIGLAGDVAGIFVDLPGPIKAVVIGLGALALVRGPLTSLFETVALKALYFKDSVAQVAKNTGGLRGALSSLAGAFSPATLGITAALALLPSLIEGFRSFSGVTDEATAAQESFADILRETNGVIDETARAGARKALTDADIVDVLDRAGVAADDAIDGLLGNADAQDRVNHALNEYLKLNPGTAHNAEAESIRLARGSYEELAGTLGVTREELEFFAGAAEEVATGAIPLVGAAFDATTAQTEGATEALEDWLKELQNISAGFVEPLSTYKDLLSEKNDAERASAEETAAATDSATDSWEDYASDVTVSLDELATRLEEQLTAQDEWRQNIGIITQRGGMEVGQILAAMGEEGVQLAAQMADGTDAEFQRMAGLLVRDAHQGGADAAAALDQELQVMAAVGARGAGATVQGIAAQLGLGVGIVRDIAARYGLNLAEGINPIIAALGRPIVQVDRLRGGFTAGFWGGGYTGDGGKLEPKGVVHGGEFVFTKEQTRKAGVGALEVWAKMLDGYATGGFVSTASVPKPYSTAPFGPPISTAAQAAMAKEYADVTAWLSENLAGGGLFEGGTGAIAALQFARSQVGKPYLWGGVGPGGYDCSGFISAVTNVILGSSPYARRGSTASMPWSGFVKGTSGTFTVGNSRNTGGGIGHMAGTLLGVNMESTGGIGVRVGGSSRGSSDSLFPERYALAFHNGGIVPNFGMPNVPALLAPGETVRTREQEAALAGPITVIAQFGTETIEARTVRVVQGVRKREQRNARSGT